MTYYVSHIKRYYMEDEKAYANRTLFLRKFTCWRKANKFYQKNRREFERKWGWIREDKDNLCIYGEYAPGGIDRDGDGPYVEKITFRGKGGPREEIKITTYYPF